MLIVEGRRADRGECRHGQDPEEQPAGLRLIKVPAGDPAGDRQRVVDHGIRVVHVDGRPVPLVTAAEHADHLEGVERRAQRAEKADDHGGVAFIERPVEEVDDGVGAVDGPDGVRVQVRGAAADLAEHSLEPAFVLGLEEAAHAEGHQSVLRVGLVHAAKTRRIQQAESLKQRVRDSEFDFADSAQQGRLFRVVDGIRPEALRRNQ